MDLAAQESDLISRQKALDLVFDNMHDPSKAYRGIMELPSAEPHSIKLNQCQSSDMISRQKAIDAIMSVKRTDNLKSVAMLIMDLPPAEPERKTGQWILDRSGAYCCSKCMEPCATYIMGKPRDKYCKMCGSRNEVDNG